MPALFRGAAVALALLPSLASATAIQGAYGIDTPTPIGPYLNGALPSEAPGAADTYEAEPAYPALRFQDPLVFTPEPNGDRIVVATRQGVLTSFVDDPNVTTMEPFLDLTDRCAVVWDGGFLGFAFHPHFGIAGAPSSQYVYAFYCFSEASSYPTSYGASNGFFDCYLRVSRFTVPLGQSAADPSSELVMMQLRLYNGSHRSGHIAFGPDGFLYVPIGDQFRYETAQDIWNNLEGGVHRIDVDMDPARSHAPLRTLPLGPSDEISGVGYWIPNDNPFVDASGATFEEYWSLGHRNPHRMTFDPATGELWIGEVGGGRREEINVVERGGNYGWPFREGFTSGPRAEPASYAGELTEPAVDFLRSESNAIIGGYVYRGARHPNLYGKYICCGYTQDRMYAIERDSLTGTYSKTYIGNFQPEGAITFGQDPRGEIYIGRQNGDTNLYTLRAVTPSPEPPQLLSSLGVFSDLGALTPAAGLVPYELNAPFWSDGAEKSRWIAVPNDGLHDTADERIGFDERGGNWSFPAGTVLVKHFEMSLDETQPGVHKRLETRFVVFTDEDFYTVSYKWLDDGTDAVLQTGSSEVDLVIETATGPRTQTWTFPGRQDCRVCHTAASGGALGVRTHQWNRDVMYPASGVTDNQLRTWTHLGVFGSALAESEIAGLARAADKDDPSASLDLRARSYLDSNCAHCHRSDAATRAIFDARLETPLYATDLLRGGLADQLGIPGASVIAPREVSRSVAHVRASALGGIAMPPLAKHVVDQTGVDVLADWIRNLDPSARVRVGNGLSPLPSIDGWESNLVVNESDVYVNATGGPVDARVEAFRFFARHTSAPVTPFVVRVLGDNSFQVAAIGTARASGDYRLGQNAFVFADGGAPRISLQPGETLATGFLDAFANGTGSGGGSGPGSVIPFCFCNEADEIWYSGGPTGLDSGRVTVGAPPTAGTTTLTDIFREYAYSIDLAIELPNTAPVLAAIDDVVAGQGTLMAASAEATDAEGDIVAYSAAGLPDGVTIDPESGRVSGWLGATPLGNYPIVVSAGDGRETVSQSFDLVVAPSGITTLYVSFMDGQLLPGGTQVWDEDIAAYDVATGTWSKYFDGSDVGVREDVRAFHLLANGDMLFAFNQPISIPGLLGGPDGELLEPHDIALFRPTSVGNSTSGTWEFFFDGSDVFLPVSNSAKIDGISEMPDGRIVVSTRGTVTIGTRKFRDEDVIALEGTLGASSSVFGRKVFDGSDVGLGELQEDIDAVSIDASGLLFFSVFTPSEASAGVPLAIGDIGRFEGMLSTDSVGTFSGIVRALDLGIDGNNVSGLHIAR